MYPATLSRCTLSSCSAAATAELSLAYAAAGSARDTGLLLGTHSLCDVLSLRGLCRALPAGHWLWRWHCEVSHAPGSTPHCRLVHSQTSSGAGPGTTRLAANWPPGMPRRAGVRLLRPQSSLLRTWVQKWKRSQQQLMQRRQVSLSEAAGSWHACCLRATTQLRLCWPAQASSIWQQARSFPTVPSSQAVKRADDVQMRPQRMAQRLVRRARRLKAAWTPSFLIVQSLRWLLCPAGEHLSRGACDVLVDCDRLCCQEVTGAQV